MPTIPSATVPGSGLTVKETASAILPAVESAASTAPAPELPADPTPLPPDSLEARFRSGEITHDDVAAVEHLVTPDEASQLHARAEANHLNSEARKLDRERPDWRAHAAELWRHAKEVLGYTDAEIGQVRDRRAIRMLYDHWRQTQQPTARPARSRDAQAIKQAATRFGESRRQRDAARLLEELID